MKIWSRTGKRNSKPKRISKNKNAKKEKPIGKESGMISLKDNSQGRRTMSRNKRGFSKLRNQKNSMRCWRILGTIS